jgi:hypothetical protein
MNKLNDNQGRSKKQLEDSYKIVGLSFFIFIGSMIVLLITSLFS